MNLDELSKVVASLQETQTACMNRQFALEAMFDAILTRVDPRVLPLIGEAYDAARDRIAANTHPLMQRPEFWQQWADRIEELSNLAAGPAAVDLPPVLRS